MSKGKSVDKPPKKVTKQELSTLARHRLAQHRQFGGVCYVCGRKYKSGGYFVFHHLWYKKGEKVYSDFKKQADYWSYVEVEIRKQPSRFILLCRGHHRAVESLAMYGDVRRTRLYRVVQRTVTEQRKHKL